MLKGMVFHRLVTAICVIATMVAAQLGTSIEVVLVENGKFMAGDPAVEVTLTEDFWIGKYPVTQAQYRAVMFDNPSWFSGRPNNPVEQVTWADCTTFARRVGGFLPTEAQWEFAARGGNLSKGFIYSGSDNIDEVAWYEGSGIVRLTQPVGQKKPNELGIYDMSGNIFEWTRDWWQSTYPSSSTNPTGAVTGSNRVVRGGCFLSSWWGCRVADRGGWPDGRHSRVGFRIAFNSSNSQLKKIRYEKNNGSAAYIVGVVGNATTITPPPVMSEGGYIAGWYKDAALIEKWDFAIDLITQDTTLYAKWLPIEYSITYTLNGGTNSAENPMTYNVETETITLQDPSPRTAYTFGGWFDNSEFTGDAITQIAVGSTGNISLFAKWIPIEYNITYILNGGTGATDRTYNIETATFALPTPTRTGYTFNGWFDDSGFTGIPITQIVRGNTGNVTLYARWSEPIEYTISYTLNGGTNSAENPTTYNVETETITLQEPSPRTAYTFGGWFDCEDFSGTRITQISKGSTGDITLYARWIPFEYSITYILNGGTGVNDGTYNIETATFTLPTPTRTGYTFNGWFDNILLLGTPITQIVIGSTGDVELYARWTMAEYTITYNLNGGTNNASNPTRYNVETETITLENPTRVGYTFDGWFNISGEAVTEIPKGSEGNQTLNARWSLITYNITYILNGGMGVVGQTYNIETPTITLANPVKTGLRFGGWFDCEDFSGTRITQISRGSIGDRILYAKWIYAVIFDSETGVTPTLIDAVENKPIPHSQRPATTAFTREGYINDGKWYLRSSNTYTEFVFGDGGTPITENNTMLYLKWVVDDGTPIDYSIIYILNGGTGATNRTYNVETATFTLPIPTRTGYTFDGWFDNSEFTGTPITQIVQGSKGSIYLFAKWNDGSASIFKPKKQDSRHGIKFTQNPVSNKAEISVVLPNNERATTTKIAIYDMTGNVVFSTTARDNASWDLRNSAGRFVANGTYLVIVEVKDRSGKVYVYSARLGVKR